jgi:exosortase/archaeosortase family protein
MWHKSFRLAQLWQLANQSTRHRIVALGLGVVAYYFFCWLIELIGRSMGGSSGLVLALGALYLGLAELWQRRQQLRQLTAGPEDHLLGSLLIVSGTLLFPVFQAFWSQTIFVALILSGIATSLWGIPFFTRYYRPALLILISLYPRPGAVASGFLATINLSNSLETFMAWGSSQALSLIGIPAIHQGRFVYIVDSGFKGVEITSGCNGFNMAFAVAVTGLLLGLFMKQDVKRTIAAMLAGVMLMPLVNIPRIMVLTLASVYWGETWFNFWHTWGGQMFTTLLLTVYYYLFMAITTNAGRFAKR